MVEKIHNQITAGKIVVILVQYHQYQATFDIVYVDYKECLFSSPFQLTLLIVLNFSPKSFDQFQMIWRQSICFWF
jgi:hypothetical protein